MTSRQAHHLQRGPEDGIERAPREEPNLAVRQFGLRNLHGLKTRMKLRRLLRPTDKILEQRPPHVKISRHHETSSTSSSQATDPIAEGFGFTSDGVFALW